MRISQTLKQLKQNLCDVLGLNRVPNFSCGMFVAVAYEDAWYPSLNSEYESWTSSYSWISQDRNPEVGPTVKFLKNTNNDLQNNIRATKEIKQHKPNELGVNSGSVN
jgi:hypothetical protein